MNDKLEKLFKAIINNLDYEKIILFGSRARGDFTEESDYDILIIMKKNIAIKEKIKLSSHLRREFAKKEIDVDIIIKSIEDINYYKDKIGNIVRIALKEGVVL